MSRIDGGVTLDLCLEVLMKTPHLVNYDQGGRVVRGGGWGRELHLLRTVKWCKRANHGCIVSADFTVLENYLGGANLYATFNELFGSIKCAAVSLSE